MNRLLILFALAAGLAACSGDGVRELGGRAFVAAEDSSVLVLDGAIRYICCAARVGAIDAAFGTAALKQSRAALCAPALKRCAKPAGDEERGP